MFDGKHSFIDLSACFWVSKGGEGVVDFNIYISKGLLKNDTYCHEGRGVSKKVQLLFFEWPLIVFYKKFSNQHHLKIIQVSLNVCNGWTFSNEIF